MSASSENVDAEIQAALSGSSQPAANDESSDDPEIAEALKQAKRKTSGEVTTGPLGFINGVAELGGKAALNVPYAAAHGAIDLYRRITGGDTDAPDPDLVSGLKVPLSNNASDVGSSIVSALTTPIPGTESAIDKNSKGLAPLKNSPVGQFVGSYVAPVAADVAELVPAVRAVRNVVKGGAEMGQFSREVAATPKPTVAETAQSAANEAASAGNAGAAGAAVDVTKLKPTTQAEIVRIKANGGTIDNDALARIAKAESVGVDLTEGQAKQDTAKMANEFNRRGENNNAVGNRFDAQDDALRDALAETHRDIAPTAVANSEIQNGQAVINGLRRYDAPMVAQIDKAYAEARSLNGGDLNLDTSGFNSGVATALKPQGQAQFLPGTVQNIVKNISENPSLNLDDFEGYRTQLAKEAKKANISGDGNAAKAIRLVRQEVEKLAPTSDASADAKEAFDKARSLNAARESEIEANPAYEAVVNDPSYDPRKPGTMENGSDLADKFVNKYTGNQQATIRLREMLHGDQEANEAMTSESLRPLRKAAEAGKGFAQDTYNTALSKLNARPELINDSDTLGKLNTIGEVGKMTRLQRRGGVFNNSGSGSVMLNAAAKAANSTLGRVALGVLPGGTEAGKGLSYLAEGSAARAAKKSLEDSIKPGAGLEK